MLQTVRMLKRLLNQSLRIALLMLAAPLVGATLEAQFTPPALDVGARIWRGRGGGVLDRRTGVGFDAMISWRVVPLTVGTLILGLNAGAAGQTGHGDSCLINVVDKSCAPDYPQFTTFGVLAGAELTGNAGTVRAMAGPALFYTDGNGNAGGVQARVDLATPALYHVAVVGSLGGALVPSFRGGSYQLGSIGIGIRIQ
jgi:hypothetical protein